MESAPLQKLEAAVSSSQKRSAFSGGIKYVDRSSTSACIPLIRRIYLSNDGSSFQKLLKLLLIKGCREGSLELVSTIVESYLNAAELIYPVSFSDKQEDLFLENLVRLCPILHPKKSSFFHQAAENGFLDVLVYLIEKSSLIDVDIPDCCGRTPLMVGLKHAKIVEYLIKMGANVNIQDCVGWTPLCFIIQTFPVRVIKSFQLLLDAGADTTVIDNSGLTVYHYAASLSHPDYLKEMIQRDCLPYCNESGLLMYANVPLCHCDVNLEMLIDLQSFFPPEVQLSLKYLVLATHGTTDNLYRSSGNITSFSQILFLQNEGKLRHKSSFQSCIFGNEFSEWSRTEELRSGRDLMFQSLVILQRVAGYGSINVLQALFNRENQPYRFGTTFTDTEYVSALILGSEMILYHLNNVHLDLHCLNFLLGALNVQKLDSLCSEDPSKIFMFLHNILHAVKICYTQLNKIHSHRSIAMGQCYRINDEVRQKLFALHQRIIDTLYLVSEGSLSQIERMHEIQDFIISSLPPLYLHDLSLSLLIYSIMDGSIALKLNTPSMISKVLEGSLEWLNIPDKNGKYLVHYAVEKQNFSLMDHLLKHGAHPDSCAASLGSPLEYAASKKLQLFGSYLHNNTYPLSLSCHAATVIAKEIVEYHIMDLPYHIKVFISLHDARRTMKELYLNKKNY